MLSPSQQKTLEELDRWQAVIDTPEKWVQGHAALRADGSIAVGQEYERAVCFCIFGAGDYLRLIKRDSARVLNSVVREAYGKVGYIDFNDDPSTTHADVMALFERAKEKVRNAAQ